MPKKTTTVSRKATKKTPVTVAKVEDIVDKSLRKGPPDQTRELESHLSDIDKRLRALEGT